MIEVDIRWMMRTDLDEVLGIEASCFEDGWTEHDFLTCLRPRNTIGMVAVSKPLQGLGDVLGFMIYALRTDKLRIVNFAVNHYHHRNRIGSQMIERLKSKAGQRRPSIRIDVRDDNLPMQLFLRSHGFRALGVDRQSYDDGEDAYVFSWTCKKEVSVG